MKRYLSILGYVVCAAFVATAAWASSPVMDAVNKYADIFLQLKPLVYICGAFGIMAVACAAFFGKMDWLRLAFIGIALMFLSLAGAIVDYLIGDNSPFGDGQSFASRLDNVSYDKSKPWTLKEDGKAPENDENKDPVTTNRGDLQAAQEQYEQIQRELASVFRESNDPEISERAKRELAEFSKEEEVVKQEGTVNKFVDKVTTYPKRSPKAYSISRKSYDSSGHLVSSWTGTQNKDGSMSMQLVDVYDSKTADMLGQDFSSERYIISDEEELEKWANDPDPKKREAAEKAREMLKEAAKQGIKVENKQSDAKTDEFAFDKKEVASDAGKQTSTSGGILGFGGVSTSVPSKEELQEIQKDATDREELENMLQRGDPELQKEASRRLEELNRKQAERAAKKFIDAFAFPQGSGSTAEQNKDAANKSEAQD